MCVCVIKKATATQNSKARTHDLYKSLALCLKTRLHTLTRGDGMIRRGGLGEGIARAREYREATNTTTRRKRTSGSLGNEHLSDVRQLATRLHGTRCIALRVVTVPASQRRQQKPVPGASVRMCVFVLV